MYPRSEEVDLYKEWCPSSGALSPCVPESHGGEPRAHAGSY